MAVRSTRAEEVTEFILDSIADGRFPVGERLPGEGDLAKLANASRLTLREAVKSLSAQRVLSPIQGRGTYVNDPREWLSIDAVMRVQGGSPGEMILQLVEIRGFLEIGATELFARNACPEQIDNLRQCLDAMVKAHEDGDVQAVVDADLAFHDVIIQGCHNPFVPVAMAPLYPVLLEARRATSNVFDIRAHAIDEHSKILAAVELRDAAAARKAMRSHMRQTAADTERYLSTSTF